MQNTYQLAARFREVILHGTWIANSNFKHQLDNLDWKIATKKVYSLNTISLIAQHIHYYIKGIKNVFTGGSLDIKDKFSFDFPPVTSDIEWETFLIKFWKEAEEFAFQIEMMPDEQLQEIFVDEKYGTYKRNIDAMIEHAYYHLGQIVLIKKIIIQDNLVTDE